jgi:predicted membrane chloride channel (bestrophin family)
MVEAPVTKRISPAMEQKAIQRARDRAKAGMWGLDIAVFLFAVLIIVIVLLFQDMGIEVVAPIAIFGLAMVWFLGWRRGRKLYQRFYDEEIAELRQELRKAVKGTVEETIEDTIEERVQRALRKRWE